MEPLTLDQALQRLCTWQDPVDSEALQVLRDNWEEALPILLHEIKSADPMDLDDDTLPHPLFHAAVFLCGERGEERAFEPLLARCAEPDAMTNVLSFVPLRKLGGVLAACGRPERLLEYYGNPAVPDFGRVVALNGLVGMGLRGRWPKASLKAWMAGELERIAEIESQELAFSLLILGAAEFPDITEAPAKAFLESRPHDEIGDLPAVKAFDILLEAGKAREEDENEDAVSSLGTADEELGELLDGVRHAALEGGFSEMEELLGDPDFLLSIVDEDEEQEVISLEGIGRNEPCPCGSGNKFKKCCAGKSFVRVSAGCASHLGTPVAAKDRRASDLMQAGFLYEKNGDDAAQLASWMLCAEALKPLVGKSAASPAVVEQKRLFVGYEPLDNWIAHFCRFVVKLQADRNPIYVAARSALDWFAEQFRAADPELRSNVLMARGVVRYLAENLEAAILDLREALRLDPDNPLARVLLAQHVSMLDNPRALDEAITLVEEGRALTRDSTFDEVLADLRAARANHDD